MLDRRRFCAGLAAAAPLIAAPGVLRAQAFPSRPIRLVVPYAAGGGTDALARVVAQAMGERAGWSVVVENITGAGGNLATLNVAAAPADGYTMLQANQGPMAVNPHIFKTMKVNPLTAFDPVTLIAAAPLVVVVPPKSEFGDFKQLMAYAKANPGKLTYGSAGNGSASHLATVLLNVVAKVDTVHVPYKGAGPALNDLLGAQTQFMVTTIPSVLGMLEGKLLRPLAVTSKERVAVLPEVPTVAESGWPDYESTAWYGFVVPAGTPKEIVETLRKTTVDAINTPLVKQRLEGEGARPIGNSPAEFAEFIKKDSARWAEIAKTGVISLN
ncbi:tripartite tricarboxylate transporter substrate binding protein [Rhodoplanes serenus]|uniref:Tripartite tricarboxylate transporter substrate binding protein n=1 Tax=Rhodoplanes serenus TaxID=200615 RepID=A0A9X4XJJ3_9BRAD|nr:tripartite tricarboxylate transporter substrate binding protein [Rhodoplanes serenus]MTW16245.1 tripartite tricarboxylate transporter substrate binding protein [Rhodoplanes serenus]